MNPFINVYGKYADFSIGWFRGEDFTLFGIKLFQIVEHEYIMIFDVSFLKFGISLSIEI